LEWDPPIRPNGDITHYVVKWQPFTGDSSAVAGHVCDDKAVEARSSCVKAKQKREAAVAIFIRSVDVMRAERSGSVDISAEEMEKNGEAAFENAVQNLVFVQQ
uniref:Fibronectin type-III domain-containing protein n=1 Tax=Parascaris equorum TaxID=6256 RepID=A0A914RRW6_PAREQ